MRFLTLVLVTVCMVSRIPAKVLIVDKINGPYTSIWAANRETAPGDTVLIRGGVYSENVGLMNDGTADAYITYKNYPGEEVIIDGSMILSSWTRCASAAEAGGNPDYAHILYCDPGRPIGVETANLYEGEQDLTVAMDPVPVETFFDKSTANFRIIPTNGLTLTTLKDPGYFTQTDPAYWVGVQIKILTGNNFVYTQEITSYDPSTNTVTFTSLPSVDIEYGKDAYAVANHPLIIKQAGQYYLDEDNRRIYLWPHNEASLAGGLVTLTYKTNAFLANRQYVRLEGMTIRRFYDNAISAEGAVGVILKNMEICQNQAREHEWAVKFNYSKNCIVDECHIHHNKHSRGILFQSGSGNLVRNTVMDQNGSTGINYYGETGSTLENNLVLNHRGQHANGLTCYNGNSNITLKGNWVRDGGAALTFQQITGMTCINNVFHSSGWAVACWNASNSINITFYNNTIFTSADNNYAFRSQSGTMTNLVFKNNICKGWPSKTGTCSNNLYINVPYYNPSLGTDEVLVDEAGVFVDEDYYDFRPASGSAAINMGTDVGVTTDIAGAARTSPDAGAFEYRTGDSQAPAIASVTAPDNATVRVVFTESVERRFAVPVTNYVIDNGIAVGRTVWGSDNKTVDLKVTPMENGSYTLTVNQVRDLAWNPIGENSTETFSVTGSGMYMPGQEMVPAAVQQTARLYRLDGTAVPKGAGRATGIFLSVDVHGNPVRVIIVR